MLEILPIKLLTVEDALIFGSLNVSLGKLARVGLPVGNGIVVTPPQLHLRTVLEHFDFRTKEVFEQTLTLVKKEIKATPVPEILKKETGKNNKFLISKKVVRGVKPLWQHLLDAWIYQIKERLWKDGFFKGVTEDLEPQVVIFIKKIESAGLVYFDQFAQDSVIKTLFGKLHPRDCQKLDQLVQLANKKLFMPYEYEWIIDRGLKLAKVFPFTSAFYTEGKSKLLIPSEQVIGVKNNTSKSAVKVFADFSLGSISEYQNIDGIYIASEKIYDLNKPNDSFDNLAIKLVESAMAFPTLPVFFKLADKSEGMGKIRGSLRLIHQKSLFDPLLQVLDFARHKKGLKNIHIVIPFVRSVAELMEVKRQMAVKKLMRKNSLQQWWEIATPENIINLEDYLLVGIDGVVFNMDELVAHFNGFDYKEEELNFYKNEVGGLIKFLEDAVKLLHKSKIPVLAQGSLTLNPQVLEFLVEKGIYGVVVERYEVPSISGILHESERRMFLRRFT